MPKVQARSRVRNRVQSRPDDPNGSSPLGRPSTSAQMNADCNAAGDWSPSRIRSAGERGRSELERVAGVADLVGRGESTATGTFRGGAGGFGVATGFAGTFCWNLEGPFARPSAPPTSDRPLAFVIPPAGARGGAGVFVRTGRRAVPTGAVRGGAGDGAVGSTRTSARDGGGPGTSTPSSSAWRRALSFSRFAR